MKSALRLHRPVDYARVKQNGKVFRHSVVLIGVCENQLSHNRYGFVTSRQVGIAVARNQCKRRLRAIVAELHSCLIQGYDIVVIARRKMLQQPFSELQRILRSLFSRAQLVGSS